MTTKNEHIIVINYHVDNIFKIVRNFIKAKTNTAPVFKKLELNKTSIQQWKTDLSENAQIVRSFKDEHISTLSKLQNNAFSNLLIFWQVLGYFKQESHKEYAQFAMKNYIVTSKILVEMKTYEDQDWKKISEDTRDIFVVIKQILKILSHNVDFTPIESIREVLICNKGWNDILAYNIESLSSLTHDFEKLNPIFSDTLTFLINLHSFTEFTINDHLNYASLSSKSLADIQSILKSQTLKQMQQAHEEYGKAHETLESPWPAIERLAAIVARL
jgi:hypothetical protein